MKNLKFLFALIAMTFVISATTFHVANASKVASSTISTIGTTLAVAPIFGASRHRAIVKSLDETYNGKVPAGQKRRGPRKYIISPSFLRVEQTLVNNQPNYRFDIMRRGSGDKLSEQKLEQNDLFVITDLAIFIAKQEKLKIGKEVMQTYPNQVVFPAAAGFDPEDLEAIYAGALSLKVKNTVQIENLPMINFRNVPSTQQSAATNRSETSQGALLELGSLIKIHGRNENEINLRLPAFAAQWASVVGTHDHILVFHPFGYLIKGVSADLDN